VTGGATSTTCTKEQPCGSLRTAVDKLRPYVKASGLIVEDNSVDTDNKNHSRISGRTVTILADDGATLMPATNGNLLVIDDSNVNIYNLEFAGLKELTTTPPPGFHNSSAVITIDGDDPIVTLVDVKIHDNEGVGVDLSASSFNGSLTLINSTIGHNRSGFGAGVFAEGSPEEPTTARAITVTHCTIEDNPGMAVYLNNADVAFYLTRSALHMNADGGVLISGRDQEEFMIVGNAISNNGSSSVSDTSGGIFIETDAKPASTSRIEFNTISGNRAEGFTPGIDCGPMFDFTTRNNIVFGNIESPPGTQISKHCLASSSLIGIDPLFKENEFPHLQAGSPARGLADPASISDPRFQCDIDNDQRTNPVDVGADEVP
jgi:hypothetical protein